MLTGWSVPTAKEWIAIGALVAFVLIPICWKFWKGWDRPSRAAKIEMKRRIRERDIRDEFIREDAKAREQQRLEAQRELSLRKAQAPPPIPVSALSGAFGSLGESPSETSTTDNTGTAVLEESVGTRQDFNVDSDVDLSKLVDSLDTDEIADDAVIPDAAPVAVQLRGAMDSTNKGEAGVENIEWGHQDPEDDWAGIGWT